MGHSASKSRLTIFFQVAKFSTCLLYYNYFPFSTCIVNNFSTICENITGKDRYNRKKGSVNAAHQCQQRVDKAAKVRYNA